MLVNEYFQPDGPGWFKIRDEVKNLVRFEQVNLLGDTPGQGDVDLVFLRNVIRYMSPPMRKKVLAQIKTQMKPDGCLFLGAQETTVQIDPTYSMVPTDKSVYFQHATQTQPKRP